MKRVVLLTMCAALLASCAYIPFSASSKRIATAPALAPTNPASVAILREPPATRYTTLGEIRVDLKGLRTTTWVARDPGIRTALQQEAGKLGADAIVDIVIQERAMGNRPDSGFFQEPMAHHVTATAIRTLR
jgi:hypothetical protein